MESGGSLFFLRLPVPSVLEAMDRCRNASATVHEGIATERADGHDGGIAQQSAELYAVAHFLANGRNHTHRRGLLVHHADGGLDRKSVV